MLWRRIGTAFGLVTLAALSTLAESPVRPAHALSQDCAGLSINATIGIGDSGSAQYTLEAGEVITFNVSLPTGTTITIIGFGESVTLSQSGSATITVPNSGPTSTGSFIFRVNSTDLNTSVQVSATCAGVTAPPPNNNAGIDANAVANVVDDQVQGALPGGNDGSVIDDFGINLSANFFSVDVLNTIFRNNVVQLSKELIRLDEEIFRLDGEIREAEDQLAELDPTFAPDATVRRAEAASDAAAQRFGEVFGRVQRGEFASEAEAEAAIAEADRESREAAEALDAARANASSGTGASDAEIRATPEGRALLDGIADRQRTQDELRDRSQDIREILSETNTFSTLVISSLPGGEEVLEGRAPTTIIQQPQREPVVNVLAEFQDDAIQNTRLGDGIAGPFMASPLRISQSGFAGRFDYREWKIQQAASRVATAFDLTKMASSDQTRTGQSVIVIPRFNTWIEGSLTFHNVDADNRDEDGYTAAVAGGVSYRFAERWEAGLVGRYAHSDRDGRIAETDLDIWSVGAFVQGVVGNGVLLQGVASASFGEGETVLDPSNTRPQGRFDIEAYQAQIKASRKFVSGRWWIEPNASLTLTHSIRDGFTATDGTIVPQTESTRVTGSLGPTIGTVLDLDGGALTPYIGANLFFTAIDTPDRVAQVDTADNAVGITGRSGFGFTSLSGTSLTLNGALTLYDEQAVDASVSGRVKVPFGR